MKPKPNEFCVIIQTSSGVITSLGEALTTRNVSDMSIVRNVIFTNKNHVDLNGETLGEFYPTEEKREVGTLFRRRKYIKRMNTQKKRYVEFEIRRLDERECDQGCGLSIEEIHDTYRPKQEGPTKRKVSIPKKKDSTQQQESPKQKDLSKHKESPKRKLDVIDISSDEDSCDVFKQKYNGHDARRTFSKKKTIRRSTEVVEIKNSKGVKKSLIYKVTERLARSGRKGKKYVYADICTGAGGTATGAEMAGLQVQFLLDLNSDSCKTLELNFPGVAVLKMDISDFATSDTSGLTGGDYVDVIHISFPCQGNSSANTGINDKLDHERIVTAYGTLDPIIKKCKPRVLTLEQVPGILYKKDGQHFRAQIGALTEAGYDLRWKVINFALYGNFQARKRVIVIAAW